MKQFLVNFRKCVDFKGKTTREYFLLFWAIFGMLEAICLLIDKLIPMELSIAGIVLSVLGLLPCLSICVRRLHDVKKPGWLAFIPMLIAVAFAPFILSDPNSALIPVFIIVEGIISFTFFYFYLQPSKES